LSSEVSLLVRHRVAYRPTAQNLLDSASARLVNADSLNVLVLHEYHFPAVIKIEFATFQTHAKRSVFTLLKFPATKH
jgi:hypothetical protein